MKGNHKLLAGIALAVGMVMAVILFSHRGLYQMYRLRHEQLRLEQENARLAAENARLARTIDRLQHDPELIQDLIRRELNFVKNHEIIFQLPPEEPGSSQVALPFSSPAGVRSPTQPHPGAAAVVHKPPRSGGSPEGTPKTGSGPPGR
jgi:cell division protein FtsB